MATRDDLYAALKNADAAGDVAGAQKLAAYIKSMPAESPEAPAQPSEQTLAVRKAVADRENQTGRNLGMGAFKGVQDIGNTVLNAGSGLANMVGIPGVKEWNDARKQSTENLFNTEASPDTYAFKGGRLASNIAMTAPVGGALGQVATKAGLPVLGNALASGGFSTGQPVAANALGRAADMGIRMIGGGATGAVSAGLINPDDALAGGAIGAALPPALAGAGKIGSAIGKTLRGPDAPQNVLAGAQAARDAGLVIPPTQVKPSLANRLLEGFSGKITTAQNASAKNQPVINDLIATELGLPAGQQVTPQALNAVREEAGKAYQALASLPERQAVSGSTIMNTPAVEGFAPKQALQELRQARNDATAWYAAYARSASPDDQAKAKAAAAIASKLENQFEEYAKSLGRDDLVPSMQEARQLIAKTYSAEKAMNPTSGNFDARKLAAQLTKGKPLSGGLRTAGEFAQQFPKAAQTVEGMGSLPQTSPLDWAVGGSLSAATANPLAMAGVLARPGARALALSPLIQNALAKGSGQPSAVANLLSNEQLQSLGYRALPVGFATQQ